METLRTIFTELADKDCQAFIGSDVFYIPSESKQFIRLCIAKDLCKEDFAETESGNIALISECEEVDSIYWSANFEDTPNDIVTCEISGNYIHIDNAIYGYIGRSEGYFSESETYYSYERSYYHEDSINYHNLVIDNNGDLLDMDYAAYCEDIEEYVHYDYAYYSEINECYYFHAENMPESNEGKEYIVGYHDSPECEDLSKGSLFKIGFEIEKTDFSGNKSEGDYIGDFTIFKGFELDSSCGVEAITNILPLSHDISYFKQLCNEAKEVINSNSNDDCGGHINVSCRHMTGSELYDSVKKYAGLFFAMYRHRLKNTYCSGDKKLKKEGGKYSAINQKSNCIEIRIPSAVKDVNQLLFRYKMTFQLLVAAYYNIPFNQYIDNCQTTLKQVYTTKNQLDKINNLAYLFQKYIDSEEVSEEIEEFI